MKFRWANEQDTYEEMKRRYTVTQHDFTGRTIRPYLKVKGLLNIRLDGQRVWDARCELCFREFAVTDAEIDNPSITICPCSQARRTR